MNFYLKKLPSGRVYLSQIAPTKNEELIQTIDAEKWIKAREKVPSDYYKRVEGEGYFM